MTEITAFSHVRDPVDEIAFLRALFGVCRDRRTKTFAQFHLASANVVQTVAIVLLRIDELVTGWNFRLNFKIKRNGGENVKIEITLEDGLFDFGAMLLCLGFVVAVDFARMGRLQLDRGVLAHFFRLPSVGERRHRLFNVAFWRRHIVPLILIERAAQTLMKPLKKRERSYHQSKPFSV